jgi:hypothetical protein
MVSSPEYEAATQPEVKMECDKDFLGEIIVKQIESNLIPKVFESSNSLDNEISLTEKASYLPVVLLLHILAMIPYL